jgi:hypothetical protein
LQKCLGCRFYDRNQTQSGEKGVRWGQCRRTGPIVHPLSAKAYLVEGIWPHVRDDDWCGEWSAGGRKPDSPATEAMSSLMTSAPPAPRPQTMAPMFGSPEPALDGARPPMSAPMRNPLASD